MSTESQWDVGELDRHARTLDAVASEVEIHARKAESLGFGTVGMYGLLPSPLILPALGLVNRNMTEVLDTLEKTIATARDGIRQTRRLLAESEQTGADNAQEITNIMDGIQGVRK